MPADQIRRMLGPAARLAVAFSQLTQRSSEARWGLVEKVKAAMATFAGPMVRTRLPPAVSQVRTCLSREFAFLRRSETMVPGVVLDPLAGITVLPPRRREFDAELIRGYIANFAISPSP